MEDIEQQTKIGRPCKTCTSSDLSEINEAMRQGVTLDRLSRQFGIYAQALSRHRRNHLASFEK